MDNADLAVKLQKVDDRSQRNEGRIKKLEETQTALNELALSVKELATDQMNMKKDIVEIKTDVKALTSGKLLSKKWFWLLWVQSSLFFSERSGSDKMFFSKRWLNRMTIVVLILIVCCAFGLPLVDITLAAIGLLATAYGFYMWKSKNENRAKYAQKFVLDFADKYGIDAAIRIAEVVLKD